MTVQKRLQISAFAAIVLFGAANLAQAKLLWGINFLKYFWFPVTIFAVATCIIFFIPKVTNKAADKLTEIETILSKNRQLRLVTSAVFAAILFILFMVFSEAAVILGDGAQRLNQIQSKIWWIPSELLDFVSHAALFRFLLKPLQIDAINSYRWVSALSGIVFVVGAYRLSIYLNPQKWLLNLLYICSSGIMVLFFGYVESYSIAAALIPWVFLSGLKTVANSGSEFNFLALLVIAGLFHSVVAICFSFAAAFVLLLSENDKSANSRKISKWLFVLFLFFISIMYLGKFLGLDVLDQHLLGFFPTEENPQHLLNFSHWLNILNWLLIAALPGIVLAPSLFYRNRINEPKDTSRLYFSIWCGLMSLLFLVVFVPQLGGPRDWDLFALPAFILMLVALTVLHLKMTQGLPSQILPAIVVSICVTIGFAGVNSSTVKSADRLEEVIELSNYKDLFAEYTNLFLLSGTDPRLHDRSAYYAIKAKSERPKEWVAVLNNLAKNALAKNDSVASYVYLNFAVKADTSNVYSHLLLLNYFNQFESFDKVMAMAKLMEHRFPTNVLALSSLGLIYLQIDSLEKAEQFYSRAISFDSNQLDLYINYGYLLGRQNKNGKSISVLRRGLQIDPQNFLLNLNLAKEHFAIGRQDSANYYLNKAELNAKLDSDIQAISELRKEIIK